MALIERYCTSAGAGAHDGTSEANAWSWIEADASAGVGQRINLKGDFGLSSAYTWSLDCGFTSAVVYRGYATTPGDGGYANFFHPASTMTFAGSGTTYESIAVSAAVQYGAVATLSDNNIKLIKCRFENTRGLADGLLLDVAGGADGGQVLGCYFKGLGFDGSDQVYTSGGLSIIGCTVNASKGRLVNFFANFRHHKCVGNLLVGASGTDSVGIYAQNSSSASELMITGNTIVNVTTGILTTGSKAEPTDSTMIMNNLIYGTTSGIDLQLASSDLAIRPALINNAIGATANPYVNVHEHLTISPVTLTADPFTDKANNDYSLNDVAGGGALCKGLGIGPPDIT